jgi:nicotinate phosphoribosyltransferase
MSFADEETAFRTLQKLLGESTVYLVDTYDSIEATRLAIRLGRPMWGVRLDSGDLIQQSFQLRQMLDDAGFGDVKIMATNDLNEDRIASLIAAGAPIDSFGVGTELATSADAPSLSAVYKLVELQSGKNHTYTAKYSEEKSTLPGAKQIYRALDRDFITLDTERYDPTWGTPLLRPVLTAGSLAEPYPALNDIRKQTLANITDLPSSLRLLEPVAPYPVNVSDFLLTLAETLRNSRYMAI